MDSIITYLLLYNQYLIKIIYNLLLFIAKYIPLNQWAFDDSNSPNYQKFKVDKLPKIIKFQKVDYKLLIDYYKQKYNYILKPVNHRNGNPISKDICCPKCGATYDYIYENNGGKGQMHCKVCKTNFTLNEPKPITLICPYCGRTLSPRKERKYFTIHKCTNPSCSYYLSNLKKLPKAIKPSTRQTAHALAEVHGIKISHTMVSNYALTAASVIKPFVDTFDYNPSKILSADETYIKVKGIRHYVWFVMDACKKSILGYQVSDTRSVGPCILAMRMAFEKFKTFPNKALKFIADGYNAYPLAKQQFELEENKIFDITQVIGLTNDDAVTKEYRWVKQIVERLNRTFKSSYRVTCGYGTPNGALYGVSLWVAYYNFLRPHPYTYWKPLNRIDALDKAGNMPAKWQLLILLGEQKILEIQSKNVS